jgi:hypothetical protein
MSSSKSNFYKLPLIHQRALHELWLLRTDSTFVVSQETRSFLEQNQTILREEFDTEFERQPFQLGEYSQISDSFGTDYLVLQDPPATPLYKSDSSDSDSESDNGDLSTIKISNSISSSSHPPSQQEEDNYINHHVIKSGVTTLRTKSPKQNSPTTDNSDNMSQGEQLSDNQNYDGRRR